MIRRRGGDGGRRSCEGKGMEPTYKNEKIKILHKL